MTEVPISKPFFDHREQEAASRVIASGWVTQGPEVRSFEEEFANYIKPATAIACSSGTTALHLMLQALGVGPGDEVIVPAFSWVATANTVIHCGARPVFCDVELETGNLKVSSLPKCLSSKTKAVIAVHLFGRCADVDAIKRVCGPIPVLEDAACAFGSTLRGRAAGTLGTMAAFSFHPRKSITTGEGGMVTTTDPTLASSLQSLRNHGISNGKMEKNTGLADMDIAGYNYRLTDIQAAVGRVQLTKWNDIHRLRLEAAQKYFEALSRISWMALPPETSSDFGHTFQSFVVRLTDDAPLNRADLMAHLERCGISARPGTYCIPDTEYYRTRFNTGDSCASATALACQSLALPLFPGITSQQINHVCKSIAQAGNRRKSA